MNHSVRVMTSAGPPLVAACGARASYRFGQLFTAQIGNPRAPYRCAGGYVGPPVPWVAKSAKNEAGVQSIDRVSLHAEYSP
jgi:hypothetical protein